MFKTNQSDAWAVILKVLRVCLKEWRETAGGRSSVQAHADSDRTGTGIRPRIHESRAN